MGFYAMESEKHISFLIFIVCFEVIFIWAELTASNGLKLTDKNLVVYNFYRGDIYNIDFCDINYIKVFTTRGIIIRIYTNYGEQKKYDLSIECSRDNVIDYLRKNGVEVKVKEWRW